MAIAGNYFPARQCQEFWDEACGTIVFRRLGLRELNPESLAVFDAWFFQRYPYLCKYLRLNALKKGRVLEIGLGFGTISQLLAQSSRAYVGLDLANGPLRLLERRIRYTRKETTALPVHGDALSLPFSENSFDQVVSIGCLHHTPNTTRAIDEIHRVLRPGGAAIVMLYNGGSFRMKVWTVIRWWILRFLGRNRFNTLSEYQRAVHDTDSRGRPAPITTFISRAQIVRAFSRFSRKTIHLENFDDLVIPKTRIGLPRDLLLDSLGRIWGSDWYISAFK